ncbi:MAG TPA: calcium-binding protein, partial [Aestuariivirga sp.]|nr:calcium-binding protein [Aestuariivirga sp.]
FVFEQGFGNDTITDFWAGMNRTDRAWLTGLGINDFAGVQAHLTDTAAGALLTFDSGDSITFAGLSAASLVADDFIFS